MKLWLLQPAEGILDFPRPPGPWEHGCGCCDGMVVRADTEEQARAIADVNAGDENNMRVRTADSSRHVRRRNVHPWRDRDLTTCVELTGDGKAGVILRDVWES